jgi:hypothetical protein
MREIRVSAAADKASGSKTISSNRSPTFTLRQRSDSSIIKKVGDLDWDAYLCAALQNSDRQLKLMR